MGDEDEEGEDRRGVNVDVRREDVKGREEKGVANERMNFVLY